jgi:ferredoxin
MPNLSDRVPENVSGKYYVDSSCVDCDQCRVQAPELFTRSDEGWSYVSRQPVTADEEAQMQEAIAACATSSIGEDGA